MSVFPNRFVIYTGDLYKGEHGNFHLWNTKTNISCRYFTKFLYTIDCTLSNTKSCWMKIIEGDLLSWNSIMKWLFVDLQLVECTHPHLFLFGESTFYLLTLFILWYHELTVGCDQLHSLHNSFKINTNRHVQIHRVEAVYFVVLALLLHFIIS